MAALAGRADSWGERAGAGAVAVLCRRVLRDARTRTIGFAYLFAAVSYLQPVAYRHTYPTLHDRVGFSQSFAHNKAVVLFYGKAYDLLTVGGYSAWRVGGTLAIFAAVFGVLAAVRALRAEEDSGRTELLLALAVGRASAFGAAMCGLAIGTGLLWLAAFAGLLAGGLPAAGSAYLALAVIVVVPVFAGVGALLSQLASTKRMAIELGAALVAACLVLRVIADTSGSASWLRWVTPLGWAEELRPFTGSRPLVLLAPLVATALLTGAAARIARTRDVGTGLLASHERVRPRLWLLSSPAAQALRGEWLGLTIWTGGVGALALVIGVVSKSVSSLGISRSLQRTFEKLGVGPALSPKAYVGFSFSFFVLIASLFAVSQLAAAHHEEADGRLETVLALPLRRSRWLGARIGLAAAGAALISLCAGAFAWAGAASQGVSLSLPSMLEAGANCLPVAVLSLGIAALAFAALPRAGAGVAYALLVVAYLWQLFGSLLGAPRWLVRATPFAHVAAVPAVPFQPEPAAVMVVIGMAAGLGALVVFARRDVTGA